MSILRKNFGIILICLLTGGIVSFFCSATEESVPGFFTLIVMPDTQNYTDSSFGGKPEYFYAQTRWICDKSDSLNIVMVAHVGDIIQSAGISRDEWKIADEAFKALDNHVPYILCLGNHDIRISGRSGSREINERYTLVNDYFPPSRFTGNPLFDRNFGPDKNLHFRESGRSDNYYLFFESGGLQFVIIALEFKPRDEVLRWADGVAAQFPERRCILITHSYLDASNARIASDGYQITGNTGEEMWNKIISRHENIFLVLCGHIMGEGLLTSYGKSGNAVHQVLADFQNVYFGNGGYGYLRIMKFFPQEDRIDVETYSPVLNKHIVSSGSRFSLEYHMRGAAKSKTGS